MNNQVTDRMEAQRAFVRALRRSSRLAQATLENVLSKFGLNYGQWSALRMVVEANEVSVGDLSREAGMTSGAMTRLVDSLEERGLVQRYRSATDRRQVNVISTPAAVEVVQAMIPVVTSAWANLLDELPTAQITELTAHLSRLIAAFEGREFSRLAQN
jgi:DNA-binding MarR family transcriptional regulator